MTRLTALACGALLGLAAALASSSCASTRTERLSPEGFASELSQMETISSAEWRTVVGVSHRNAYIEYGRPALFGKQPVTILHWVPLSELPPKVVEELQSSTTPRRADGD